MRIVTLAIYMFSLPVALGAAGTDHFPLTEGIIYEYEYRTQQGSGTYINFFSGIADVGGTTTRVQHFGGDGHERLLHFWSETPEGDKLYHGARIDTYTLLFSPPILMIDEPLYVGKIWEVDSRDSDSLAVRVHFEVTAFGEITVPAGTFQAFTVEDTWEFPEGIPAGKFRVPIRGIPGVTGTAQQTVRRTYANGVGELVWEEGSRTDRLLSFRTVAVEPSTWTRIRRLYR